MQRVLILCTGNSCRSQLAEALWNQAAGSSWQAFSAGSHPAGYVHPMAIEVAGELGIDLTNYRSKSADEFTKQPWDLVVTVCDRAKEGCPTFPNAAQTLHWPFDDPAEATGTREERLQVFRRVRDQIKRAIDDYLQAARRPGGGG